MHTPYNLVLNRFLIIPIPSVPRGFVMLNAELILVFVSLTKLSTFSVENYCNKTFLLIKCYQIIIFVLIHYSVQILIHRGFMSA